MSYGVGDLMILGQRPLGNPTGDPGTGVRNKQRHIQPCEAIAIALQTTFQLPARDFAPGSITVKNILDALEKTGWKIVARE